MLRRDILKVGAAASLVACAHESQPPVAPPSMSADDLDSVLGELDATLGKLRAARPDVRVLLGAPAPEPVKLQRGHDLVMKTLASMHVAATFRDLPPDVQRRPEVQERMWRALPEIDDAMLSLTEYMRRTSPAERKALQRRLRKEPELSMRVVEQLDAHASAANVGLRRRTQMRTAAAHATWRMTNQSVDAVFDELVNKADRVRERTGRDAEMQRAIGAKLAEVGLFGMPKGALTATAASAASGATGATDAPAPAASAAPVDPEGQADAGAPASPSAASSATRDAPWTGGERALAAGGILLGLGVVAGGVGLAIASTGNILGLFIVTAGAVMGLGGIIALIVGAIVKLTEPSKPAPSKGSQ